MKLARLRPVEPAANITFAPADSKRERRAVSALLEATLVRTPPQIDFLKWRLEEYWKLVDTGRGRWWGAWLGRRLASTVGLFDCGGILRFQDLVTLPPLRHRGLGTALCWTALGEHPARDRHKAIAVAEPDSHAERLYRRLGFVNRGWQFSWLAPRVARR